MESSVVQPLVVLCGPTASGKSDVAMQLAEQYNGEIICADSRTIYKGMDIGTAKPSRDDQRRVRHHLLDVVEPGESFSAFDFQQRAYRTIEAIRAQGKLPILVGGTGLYIDAVIYEYTFAPKVAASFHRRLEDMTLDELHEYSHKHNISLPENSKNKRYVIRSIERSSAPSSKKDGVADTTIVVGITTKPEELRQRITQRAEYIFTHGVVEEATLLGKKYGWDNEAMTGNIYPLIRQYLCGGKTLDEVKEKFITLDWRLAKRQRTWLKRNPDITWLTREQATHFIAQRLADFEQK